MTSQMCALPLAESVGTSSYIHIYIYNYLHFLLKNPKFLSKRLNFMNE